MKALLLSALCQSAQLNMLSSDQVSPQGVVSSCEVTVKPPNLTDVRRDDGEGAEVRLPHVLRQRVGVFLEVSQQRRRAAFRLLDHLPVEPRVRRQDGAAHVHHILPGKSQSSV